MPHQKIRILDMLHRHFFYFLTEYSLSTKSKQSDFEEVEYVLDQENFLRAILLSIWQCVFSFFALLQSKGIFINLRCHSVQKPLEQRHNSLPQSAETSLCILKSHLNLQVKRIATESKTEMITYEQAMFGRFLFYCNLLALFHLQLQP